MCKYEVMTRYIRYVLYCYSHLQLYCQNVSIVDLTILYFAYNLLAT